MLRSLLRRLLFVKNHTFEAEQLAGTGDAFLLTGLVEGSGLRRRRAARHQVKVFAEQAAAHRDDWKLDTIETFKSTLRWFDAIMRFTRTNTVVRFLCWLAATPPPPPFDLAVSPRVDAAVEIRFQQRPDDAVLDQITSSSPNIDWIASEEQVIVYDQGGRAHKSVYQCFLVFHLPMMSRASCQQYWRTQHAQFVLYNMNYLRLTKYRQVHTAAVAPPGCIDTFDGVVWARKASRWAVIRQVLHINAFRFNNALVVDETNFTYATRAFLLRPHKTW